MPLFCATFFEIQSTLCSNFSRKDEETELRLVKEYQLSKEPINSIDWSPDRAGLAVCGSFNKMVQVLVSANLPLLS